MLILGRQTLILSDQRLIHLHQQFVLLFHGKPSLQFLLQGYFTAIKENWEELISLVATCSLFCHMEKF